MRAIAPAILVVVTFLSYIPVLQNGFVYDDHFQLERNPYIRDFRHLDILLTKEVWHFSPGTNSNNYRPLHMISYLLLYQVFGLNPLAYHLAALLLYILSVLLVWKICAIHVESFPALIAALLFATHPVHVESVAWVGGFPDLLCGLFIFVSYFVYRHGKNALSLASFGFALFSKEPALMFPLVIAADQIMFRSREKRGAILWHAGAAILILGYAAFRMYALGSFMRTTSEGVSLFPFLYSGLSFAGLYIGKMIFPLPLNAFYHFSLPLSFTISWAGLLLCLSALILVYAFRKNRVVLLGCIWFGLFLGPALVLKDVSPVLFAERYLYLPSAGFILAVVAFAYSRERSDRSKRYISYFMIVVAILFAGVTYARSSVWRDDLTLWRDTAEKSPQSVTVQYNLGTAYLKSKQYQQASIHYTEAVRQDPQKADAYYNLAICQYWLGQKQSAAESLKKFLQYAPATHPMKRDAEQKLQQLQPSKATRPVE